MAKNVGREDRGVRVVAAIGLAILAYYAGLSQVATIVVWVLAAYLLLSGLFGMCLFYKLIDVDTSVQEQPYSSTDDRAGL
jgi:hypothetical protein